MSSPEHALATVLGAAYALTVLAAPQEAMTEEKVVIIAISAGLVGGIISTLSPEGPITLRNLVLRMLASGSFAPVVVWAFFKLSTGASFTMLPVASAAGLAGIVAWPFANVLGKMVTTNLVKKIITKLFGGAP